MEKSYTFHLAKVVCFAAALFFQIFIAFSCNGLPTLSAPAHPHPPQTMAVGFSLGNPEGVHRPTSRPAKILLITKYRGFGPSDRAEYSLDGFRLGVGDLGVDALIEAIRHFPVGTIVRDESILPTKESADRSYFYRPPYASRWTDISNSLKISKTEFEYVSPNEN